MCFAPRSVLTNSRNAGWLCGYNLQNFATCVHYTQHSDPTSHNNGFKLISSIKKLSRGVLSVLTAHFVASLPVDHARSIESQPPDA